MRRVDKHDVGKFFLGPDDEVWKLTSYCEYPTATWERVDDSGIRCGGAVGSPLVRDFRRLVPEDDA